MHGQQNIKILSLSFGFRLILLLDDDVFPWFVYAVITLETDALDTPKKVAVCLQILQLNAQQQSVLFEYVTSFPFRCTFMRTVIQHSL